MLCLTKSDITSLDHKILFVWDCFVCTIECALIDFMICVEVISKPIKPLKYYENVADFFPSVRHVLIVTSSRALSPLPVVYKVEQDAVCFGAAFHAL